MMLHQPWYGYIRDRVVYIQLCTHMQIKIYGCVVQRTLSVVHKVYNRADRALHSYTSVAYDRTTNPGH
eukprot:SAG31_NODE_15537_length_749_cov_6.232311_2_plen_68_part_00